MKCYIVKDLLPNYIDGLNSNETNAEIKEHLDECADCRIVYESMTAVIPQGVRPEDKDINFIKKLKAKMLRKNFIVAVCTCIVVLGGLFFFARTYEIPIAYDPYRMSVEVFPAALVSDADGRTSWWELRDIESPEGIVTDPNSDTVIPTEYEHVKDLARIAYWGFGNISERTIGRSVNRSGEDVRVVYYCYSKTLWNSLFYDYDLSETQSGGSSYGSDIYGDSFQSTDYKPQMIEIYYLPIRNLHKLDNLSDEDYDTQREIAYMVWSGVI